MNHHETESARTAEKGGGAGHFNVVECDPRVFRVINGDGGMTLSEHTTLGNAMKAARREAHSYDLAEVERLLFIRARTHRFTPGAAMRITGLGAYEGRWVVAFNDRVLMDDRDGRMAIFPTKAKALESFAERSRVWAARAARASSEIRP